MFLAIWEDPKIQFSPYCPPKRFQPTLVLLNLQVLSPAARAACVQCLMKSPTNPPWPLGTEMSGITRTDLDQESGRVLLWALEGQTPLVIFYWHTSGKQAQHIYLTFDVLSIPLFVFLASCQIQLPSKISTFFPVLSTLSTMSSTLALGSPHSGYWSTVLPLFPFN